MAGMEKQRIKGRLPPWDPLSRDPFRKAETNSIIRGGYDMSNKGADKAQTGKPDRGKNSPFKKKTPQSRA